MKGSRGSGLPSVDPDVRDILKAWSQEKDREKARKRLAEAAAQLPEPLRVALVKRMAEVALGALAVIEDRSGD